LDRKLGGPQSRSGRGGEEKNSQPPSGIEPQNPDRPARSPQKLQFLLMSILSHVQFLYIKSSVKKFEGFLCSLRANNWSAGQHPPLQPLGQFVGQLFSLITKNSLIVQVSLSASHFYGT
jgi:hypothetical protein